MRASAAAESSLESRCAAGVTTLFYGASAALVAGLALRAATGWPQPAVVSCALAFGGLVASLSWLIGRGPIRGPMAVAGRAAIAIAVGVVVGELAALAVFAGAVDRSLDDAAARSAVATPAVMQASADLAQSRSARNELDIAVDSARARLDQALVVARCEYNPSPACPVTRITGLPGRGPETLTANELLADARQELDSSLGARGDRAPALDAAIADDERVLGDARAAAVAAADRGLGARWVAMHDHTLAGSAQLVLRLVTIAFFVLLSLLPLMLALMRGHTSADRRAAAAAERERAELEADTAIAVKRTELRRTAEILWAEQQLASVRLAVDAQHEIDRALQSRRVAQALEGPANEPKQLDAAPVAALPTHRDDNLPAPATSEGVQRPLIPNVPELTRSAARWIRPLVPTIVAKAIDSTTHPVRTARQVFEEVEEIHFSLRRTHTVALHSEDNSLEGVPHPGQQPELATSREDPRRRVDSTFVRGDLDGTPAVSSAGAVASRSRNTPLGAGASRERGLPEPDGVRQLPPGG